MYRTMNQPEDERQPPKFSPGLAVIGFFCIYAAHFTADFTGGRAVNWKDPRTFGAALLMAAVAGCYHFIRPRPKP